MRAGEEQAWEKLASRHPPDVCRLAGAVYDETAEAYALECLAQPVEVRLRDRTIASPSEDGAALLARYRYFSHLSVLTYLATARDVTPAGQWVKPADLRSGDIYYKGSHVLPLDGLAGRFDGQPEAFLERGAKLGGRPLQFGDASLCIHPLPRVPVAAILWVSDDEFPARADLLLDSTCELHAPADIIWSVAMFSVLMLMS